MKKKKKSSAPLTKRIKTAALQSGIGLLGAGAGTGAAAGLGKFSPFLGLALLGAGYFIGGKWQFLTVAGAATLGYGLAKAQENRISESIKERLVDFKNDWLHGFYFDKLMNKGSSESEAETDETIDGIGAIDLSELDDFEERLKESAIKFQMRQMDEEPEALEKPFENEDQYESEEANYSILEDDEIDFDDF